jgi:hypothetical protein
MTTHTPGPWACTYTSNHAHDYRLTRHNGQPLPINAEANDRSEQRANARLIAAAPDLIAALVTLLPHAARAIQGTTEGQPLLEAARAAINKATQEPAP